MTGTYSRAGQAASGRWSLAGISWQKSSLSAHNGNCVEVAQLAENHFAVRDSKNSAPGYPALIVDGAGWVAFLSAVKKGEFDLP
jgi:hypothetical protein